MFKMMLQSRAYFLVYFLDPFLFAHVSDGPPTTPMGSGATFLPPFMWYPPHDGCIVMFYIYIYIFVGGEIGDDGINSE